MNAYQHSVGTSTPDTSRTDFLRRASSLSTSQIGNVLSVGDSLSAKLEVR